MDKTDSKQNIETKFTESHLYDFLFYCIKCQHVIKHNIEMGTKLILTNEEENILKKIKEIDDIINTTKDNKILKELVKKELRSTRNNIKKRTRKAVKSINEKKYGS